MTHVDEGVLQGFSDRELPDRQLREVERHLEECARCRSELRLVRSRSAAFAAAMSELDRAEPRIGAEPPALRRRRAASPGWGSALPRAAVLVLGFAAAASATIPGSPVRRWLSELGAPAAEVQVARAPEPVRPPEAVAAAPAAEMGVSVPPEAGTVRVVLRDAARDLRVRTVLIDGPRAGVFASSAVPGARFSTAPGRIEVTGAGAGAGELRIELPRGAVRATVEVNGRRYLAKEGDHLRLAVPADDSASAEVTFRVQS